MPNPIPLGLCQCGCGRKTKPAQLTDPARGYVKGQPHRYARGHHGVKAPTAPLTYRFGDDVPHRESDWPWKIPLRRHDGTVRAYALIDEADYEWAMQWRWHLNGPYASRNIPGQGRQHPVALHRFLLGLELGDRREVGDHINHEDKLDNRRTNLRRIPSGGNPQNTPPRAGSTSPHRGVSLRPNGRWQAEVQIAGVRHYLGLFDTDDEAAAAALAYRLEHMTYAVD